MASPDPAAGNLGTTTRQISDDLHALVDQDRIWRAIAASMRFHASNKFFFTERQFEFAVTSGRANYAPGDGFGLPADLQEIVRNRVYLRYQGLTNQSQRMEWISQEEYELRQQWDTVGTPIAWTFTGRLLKLVPTPNNSADVITAPYVANLGIPRFQWTGSAYVWFAPDGATLTDAYTNDFLQWDFAEQLTRMRATYELCKSLKDPDAETWLGSWLEAKSRLEDETDEKVAGGMTRLVPRLL
jgi:hypothetical protein